MGVHVCVHVCVFCKCVYDGYMGECVCIRA